MKTCSERDVTIFLSAGIPEGLPNGRKDAERAANNDRGI
jgi:hypothetical protein